MKYTIAAAVLMLTAGTLLAQTNVSGLNSKQFKKFWTVESESPEYKVSFDGDTLDIVSPKGLTLWRNEKMHDDVTIEYDACIVNNGGKDDRTSDLNCFWMASDPKNPDNIFARAKWRGGVFVNCYSLQLYYMGYGGNYNATTRFRRYDGNEDGVTNADVRPAILTEYTDEQHLITANHWYHIKLTCRQGKVCYYIDGQRIVDFRDPRPLKEGWFGFRTTWSHARLTNFRYSYGNGSANIEARWIGETPHASQPVTFGVPFRQGEHRGETLSVVTADGNELPTDQWPLARWADGSTKWMALSTVVPGDSDGLTVRRSVAKKNKATKTPSQISREDIGGRMILSTGPLTAYMSDKGSAIIDSMTLDGKCICSNVRLVGSLQDKILEDKLENVNYTELLSEVTSLEVEQSGRVRTTVKVCGHHKSSRGTILPFVVRLYFYAGSEQVKMVHTFIYNGEQNVDFIRSLGVRCDVPMSTEAYNRHVAFAVDNGGVWSEPVQPLVGRRRMIIPGFHHDIEKAQLEGVEIPTIDNNCPALTKELVDNWAKWNTFRLSQNTADGYTIRKKATDQVSWVGTMGGNRADGVAFVGDTRGGLALHMTDFWQSFPSSFEVTNATSSKAVLTSWLWSPDAEPMDLRHYDKVAHGLNASYEDVQEGMSTPYGIARTTTLTFIPQKKYNGKASVAELARQMNNSRQLACTPQYLHDVHAFGIWSLPDTTTPFRRDIENTLSAATRYYNDMQQQHKWYGFWNYGDFMHTYDRNRHEWLYDVGGYAWDNTELATNSWLWYSFLRTGDATAWRLAEAMTRHTSEVDVYHIGPNAGLGSRHNVSHWGCGAKEARISQAAWNRFYYYLTADERCGDLMKEVKDCEQKLYDLDPMRLAEPRDKYPCNAPTRLRIGPDWIAYAGNWMTEWERTGNKHYLQMLQSGMKSIASLKYGIFTGNKALGFDPATGIVSYDGDSLRRNTNHLLTIMGGFEIMNELLEMIDIPEWNRCWLQFARDYKNNAKIISKSSFRVSRLEAYASWQLMDNSLADDAWADMMKAMPLRQIRKVETPQVQYAIDEDPWVTTNDIATWGLDAIFMLEVCPK